MDQYYPKFKKVYTVAAATWIVLLLTPPKCNGDNNVFINTAFATTYTTVSNPQSTKAVDSAITWQFFLENDANLT